MLCLFTCIVFCSCSNGSLSDEESYVYRNEDKHIVSNDGTITQENEYTPELIKNMYIDASALLRENGAIGGGNHMLERKYEEETYNIAYLRKLYVDEITILPEGALDQWIEEVYMKKNEEEIDAFPTIYQAIHDLNISKDDLIALNESRKLCGSHMIMSDEYIDVLYLTETEMMQELVDPLALYYDGVIYTWNDLNNVITSNNKAADIPASVMKAYIDHVITYCGEHGFITGNAVERFFGSTSAMK